MTMRERIARAIFDSLHGDTHNTQWDFGEGPINVSEEHKQRFFRMADAVLKEMREPSEAMETACYNRWNSILDRQPTPTDLWQAMIDAASEGEG